MAVRQQKNTGLIVTLIIFVVAFITCLVLAIMFYTKIEQERTAARGANETLNKFIEPARRSAQEMDQYAAAGREVGQPSVVSYLESEVKALKRLLTGAENVETSRARADLVAAGAAEGIAAIDHIRSLATDLENARKQVADITEQVKAVQAQVEALETMRDRIEADAKAQADKLDTDLAQLRAGIDQLDAGQKAALAALDDRIKQAQAEATEKRNELENEYRDLQKERDNLQDRLTKFIGSITNTTPDVPDPSTAVDGEIIRIPQREGVVYINLGRKDHLVLGMTFEVFDVRRGVGIEEVDGGRVLQRGKASIEVISMSDNSSICKVVRTSFGQPIQVGDLIANLVYDRQRTYKFFVFGDFNLDGIGEASLTDREMVIHYIEQWGGEVVKIDERERGLQAAGIEGGETTLPFDTDFLIVGEEPRLPEVEPDASDVQAAERVVRIRKQLDSFQKLHAEARALGVPVLNQNRFLALIGYYQR